MMLWDLHVLLWLLWESALLVAFIDELFDRVARVLRNQIEQLVFHHLLLVANFHISHFMHIKLNSTNILDDGDLFELTGEHPPGQFGDLDQLEHFSLLRLHRVTEVHDLLHCVRYLVQQNCTFFLV
ncbi:hypothetical protein WR25_26999 [Diploscapter pachys]|uniref:Secreted protein n=1 Tax=Diploscapter pachys TaxID=2018661 RepID=A0A2A2L7D7_9BILA|nr:hypothetical protein WR25_26999 [Diploscapter pachys]